MTTQHTRYQNLTLEANLKSSCIEITEQSKIGTENFASRNLPTVSVDHWASYFEKYHLMFQALIDKVNSELQFQTTCHEVKEHEQLADNKYRDLSNKLAEAKMNQIPIEEKVKNTPEPNINKKQILWARVVTYAINFFEGILSIPVFEAWGCNLFFSALLGLGLAIVLSTFAEMFRQILALGKTKLQRRVIVASLFFLTLGLYIFLSKTRVDYLNNMMSSLHMEYSPWPFVFLSEFLLIVAVAVCYFNLPTESQKLALREHEKVMNEKNNNENEIKNLNEQIASVQQEHSQLKNDSISIMVFGAMMEESVINHARACFSLFKNHNLMHRSDHCKPDCQEEEYPFTFKTNFHQIKLLAHHENNN